MKRRLGALALASSMALVLGLASAPAFVVAGAPTEISVSPPYRNMSYCEDSPRAYWTVALWGGTSGSFTWSVTYGDGTSSGVRTAPGPWAEFDRHHDYACGVLYAQVWTASRSGGGTAHDYTSVQAY
jgi:hypothetical protein